MKCLRIEPKNIVPISHAQSHLAQLLKRAAAEGRPIVVTQKGRAEAVIISVAQFDALLAGATGAGEEL